MSFLSTHSRGKAGRPWILLRALVLPVALLLAREACAQQTISISAPATVQVQFSARSVYDDPDSDGAGNAAGGVYVAEQSSGQTFFLQVGGPPRNQSRVTPRSGTWRAVGPQPNVGTLANNYSWEIDLPAGTWNFTGNKGTGRTRITTPSNTPGDPPDVRDIYDSYLTEGISVAVVAGGGVIGPGSGGGATSAPGANYTLTWTAASGGQTAFGGGNRTVAVRLPNTGGSASLTATAASPNGGS